MSHRRERVGDEIRAEISRLLRQEVKDPRVGFVTVTEVRMSGDLRSARVYVSVLGDASVQRESLAALRSAEGFLQRRIGGALGLRHTPQLRFELDLSIERGSRIERLLEEVGQAETSPGEAGEEILEDPGSSAAGDDKPVAGESGRGGEPPGPGAGEGDGAS